MTLTAPPPGAVETEVVPGAVSPPPRPPLPFWLRKRPARSPRPRPTPRQARWWIGVAWMILSVLLLGFVAHVTLFGALQHSRSQAIGYDELRVALAKAEAPLGQLGVDETLVAPGTPFALLAIPRLGLTEVIRQGTSSAQLREGVGHRRDTVMPGQKGTSILFGRQSAYGGPFGGLSALVPGDRISVQTGQGTFDFTVFGIRRPGDPLPVILAAGQGRIELVTADGPALSPVGVLYIDASLDGDAADTPAVQFTDKALNPGEGVMETDPNGWLPLLFSLQWLVAAAVIARWLTTAWGRWQAWIIAGPVLLVLGATTADCAMALLPNLI